MNDPTKVKNQTKCANALDTLAQLGKNTPKPSEGGEGVEALQRLKKRARAKYVQQPLLLALVDEAKRLGHETMEQSYWNTHHCVGLLDQKGDKITGRYCNNRWCIVCSRIRTGKLINKYYHHFTAMAEPRMVTLTAPTVSADELDEEIFRRNKAFKQIQEVMKKRGTPLFGIRKLECQYNSETGLYHPHFHVLIDGQYEAEVLLEEWLHRIKNADIKGQDITNADDEILLEIFKYTTKLCSKDMRTMNAPALHNIFTVLRNYRTFQSLGGFGKSEADNDDEINPVRTEKYTHVPPMVKKWYWEGHDWKDTEGEVLSGYEPSEAIEQFRNNLEQCNVNTVKGNSPRKTSSSDTVQTDADKEHFTPVKHPNKRPYNLPRKRIKKRQYSIKT